MIKKIIPLFFISHACFSGMVPVSGNVAFTRDPMLESNVMKRFDHVIVCEAKYSQKTKDSYEYYCPQMPNKKNIVSMQVIFDDSGWPNHIVYYMRNKDD